MSNLLTTAAHGIAILTINRPDARNAINGEVCDELLSRLTSLSEDEQIRVVILTGAGSAAFCAGGDVKHMDGIAKQSFDDRLANLRRWGRITLLLHNMPKITIAMVNGIAAGAGLSLAAACDLRFAARSARFATAYARIARSGDFGGSFLLTRLIGGARARELYLLGEIIDSAKADNFGLVNRVFEDAELSTETMVIARRLADGPPIAYGYIKQNLFAAENMPLAEMVELEALHHAKTGETAEHLEAVKAFRDRRTPNFKGL